MAQAVESHGPVMSKGKSCRLGVECGDAGMSDTTGACKAAGGRCTAGVRSGGGGRPEAALTPLKATLGVGRARRTLSGRREGLFRETARKLDC
jgi:hypothetical protein